jgi:hypothetical protein
MALTEPLTIVLCEFASAFLQPTWNKAQVLIVGTPLTRGCRTVAAALRQMGLHDRPSVYIGLHHSLIGSEWYLFRGQEAPRHFSME